MIYKEKLGVSEQSDRNTFGKYQKKDFPKQ